MARLYKVNIIAKEPDFYGTLVFCHVPTHISILPFPWETEVGYLFDNQLIVSYFFNKLVKEKRISILNDKVISENSKIEKFFASLQQDGWLVIEKGNRESITYMPISESMGFLSDVTTSQVLCNSHFFLMDMSDNDSPYDIFGTSYALALHYGRIIQPPLLHRECLLVDTYGMVSIKNLEVKDFPITIDEKVCIDTKNCNFYCRPERRITPMSEGSGIIIVNQRVVALKHGGNSIIPMGGFVIQSDEKITIEHPCVTYQDMNEYVFGIQVGPAMMKEDRIVISLTTPFYTGKGVPFPSTVYPLPFETARAARMGIGNKGKKPVIIWAEGVGISNFVNIDGGGSVQIIHNGSRALEISDRYTQTNKEAERPIPLGLIIKGI